MLRLLNKQPQSIASLIRFSLVGIACVVLEPKSLEAMRRVEVDFNYVTERASELSERRYRNQRKIPAVLAELKYDGYQKIHYNNNAYLWMDEGLPFAAGFFHLGYLFTDSVRIHEFTATHEQRIRYIDSFFQYDDQELKNALPSSLDYAGYRISTNLKEGDSYSEIASFLGASYFRGVGYEHRYGASARGIAINSGLSEPEEFPRFTQAWLGKPLGNAKEIVVYALMDSPSLTGAYEFKIKPGFETVMDVRLHLFFRESVQSFGVAPMTSMFWRGENRRSPELDYRPEVHDSDGLIIKARNSDPIWRPLDLDDKTRLSFFSVGEFEGFGLMQRDRSFESFQDMEAEYHHRPSVWIETKGDWGPGYVKLVELPTDREFDDNVIAFWEPAVLPEKGSQISYEYSIHWTSATAPETYPEQRVVATRIGEDLSYPGTHVFVIDYKQEGVETSPVAEVIASVSEPSELIDARHAWNSYTKSWRTTLRVKSVEEDVEEAVELRCQLSFEDGTVSEVWAYQWTH